MPPTVPAVWHQLSAESVVTQLNTSTSGLTAIEAARRLAADGPNALTEGTRVTVVQLLLGQFKSVIIWILIAAGVISAVLGDPTDAFAIFAIVVLNAAIGFYQEFRAEKSIAALKQLTAPQATLRRDGKILSIPAAGLVTGDILVLAAGDLVAADARLLTAASLKCIESALTGESSAVKKSPATLPSTATPLGDRANLVFMGTAVATGSAEAVVVATAMKTELGRIAGLLTTAGAEEETPLQRKLDAFGRVLVWAALGIVALLFGLGLLRGSAPLELLLTSISLAVAAVPEGLPAVVTVALSLGVLRMARRRALVRKLAAVETLGSTNVICTDKTGTLTVGEMTARAFYVTGHAYEITGEGYGPTGEIHFNGKPAAGLHLAPLHELATILVACNQAHLVLEGGAWKTIGDPTEGALLVAGAKAGVDRATLDREQPVQHEFPFDSDRKLSSVLRRLPDGKLRAYCNGAPGILLAHCTHLYTAAGTVPLTAAARDELLAHTAAFAKKSLRVLGSAHRDLPDLTPADLTTEHIERELVFVGLTGMHDPPRPEARAAVARCRAAGIRAVMITGDHPETAAPSPTISALPPPATSPSPGSSSTACRTRVCAGTWTGIVRLRPRHPAHKLRIVARWKANDAVVAMTGDGVNDAPAIKGADIGIAMGSSGTEVTKQASDMIVTDDNFATIVAAVEEGRASTTTSARLCSTCSPATPANCC
jgi:Ca2+-transporting ATPase